MISEPAPANGSERLSGCTGDGDIEGRLARLIESSELVRSIVRGFLHLRPDEVDRGIEKALQRLGEFLGTDRVYTFENHGLTLEVDGTMDNTFEWCAEGITPEIDNLQKLPVAVMESWFHVLNGGEHVMIPDVDQLPDTRSDERGNLEAQGIQSILVVPMMSIGDLVGIMGFDSVRTKRSFEPFEIGLLRSVADVITSVLVRRRADAVTARAEQRLAAMTQYAADVILVVDEYGVITYASQSCRRLGFEVPDIVGRPWRRYVHPDDLRSIVGVMERRLHNPVAERLLRLPDLRVKTGCGDWRWLSGSVSDARRDGVIDGFVVNAHDVTDRRKVEDQMSFDAMHDPLTGLGNRAMLTDRLRTLGHDRDRRDAEVALLFLDLDRFKLINDGHGHSVGDQVLVEIGRRLAGVVRPTDTVARFGGDEFVVLVEPFGDTNEVAEMVQRFRAAMAAPVAVGDKEHRVTASIGVVLTEGRSLDPALVLRDADTAMYRAKEAGRDRVVVFDETLRTQVMHRVALNERLPKALERGLLDLAYQPLVELVTGRLVGAEALLRWTDPELGVVSPMEFIPIAEETGLIIPLGEMVLEQAIAEAVAWTPGLEVAVNLSLSQLTQPGLVDLIRSLLHRYGLPSRRLCVEITESSLINHPANVIETLHGLRTLGVRTALDDFGTGYSSLALLRELPIDVLKIDRAFVRGVHCDDRDRRLVDAVIGLASDFGMTPLAEGVELEAQRLALINAGCSLAQGYLFGRPMSAAHFRSLQGVTPGAHRVRAASLVGG